MIESTFGKCTYKFPACLNTSCAICTNRAKDCV